MIRSKLSTQLFTLLLIIPLAGSAAPLQEMIIGTWMGVDSRGMSGGFGFMQDGRVHMVVDGETLTGDKSPIEVLWKVHDGTEPLQLDLIFREVETRAEVNTEKMIVRFIGEEKMQLRRPDEEGKRPTGFSEADDDYQVTLSRSE